MSTTINTHDMLLFIKNKIGADLDEREAKELGVETEYEEALEESDEVTINIEDIVEDQGDLYEKFAVMYQQEENAKTREEDEDKKKEKENKVKDKNQAKA